MGALEFRKVPDTFLPFPSLPTASLVGNRKAPACYKEVRLLLAAWLQEQGLKTPWNVSPQTCSGTNWSHGNQDLLLPTLSPVGRGEERKGEISELASPAVAYGKVC